MMNRHVKNLNRKVREKSAIRSERVRDLVYVSMCAVVSLGAVVVGSVFGNVHSDQPLHTQVVAWVCAGVFLVFGVVTTRRLAGILGHAVARTMVSAGGAVRLIASIVGYIIVLFAFLGILDVSIEHLLVGGALTGVVLGIAAQQSLGNVFAGIVLLLARPFGVGDHIRLRSGALGGSMDGVVLAMSLTYVTLYVEGAPLKIPNSGVLAAAVGPHIKPPPPPPEVPAKDL